MLGYHHSTVHVVGLLLTRLARPNKDSLTIQERETLPLSCSCSCFPSLVFWLAMLFWFCKCIMITWLGIILPSRSGCPLELALTVLLWGYHTLTIVCCFCIYSGRVQRLFPCAFCSDPHTRCSAGFVPLLLWSSISCSERLENTITTTNWNYNKRMNCKHDSQSLEYTVCRVLFVDWNLQYKTVSCCQVLCNRCSSNDDKVAFPQNEWVVLHAWLCLCVNPR